MSEGIVFVSLCVFPGGKGMGPAFKVAGSDEENLVLVGWRGADRRPQFGKFGKIRVRSRSRGKVSHEGFGRAGLIEFLKGSVSRHEVKVVGLGQFVRQVLGQSLGTGKPVRLEDNLKKMIGQLTLRWLRKARISVGWWA